MPMSCCIDLHYLLYYQYDLHCYISGDRGGEVSWFAPPLPLFQLCQPDHKKQFIKKLLSNLEYGIFKVKGKFLNTTVIIFFINNKTHCTYFHPLMPGGSKRSNIFNPIKPGLGGGGGSFLPAAKKYL